jgi:hypothetical protein
MSVPSYETRESAVSGAASDRLRAAGEDAGREGREAVLSAAALGGYLRGEPGAGPVAAVLPGHASPRSTWQR